LETFADMRHRTGTPDAVVEEAKRVTHELIRDYAPLPVDLAAHAAVDGSPDALRGLVVYGRRGGEIICRMMIMGLRYDPVEGNFRNEESEMRHVFPIGR
jgi:hypothetical protein